MKRYYLDQSVPLVGPSSEADTEPKWCQLFPLGREKFRGDFPGGSIRFDEKFLGSMLANWQRAGSPHLQVNFFHRGLSMGDLTPVADKVAAGWIEALELRADGLWGLIRWTGRARAHILADELRYLSPEFQTDSRDRNTGKPQGPALLGAALLNDPFLEELPRVAASASSTTAAQVANEGAPMNWLAQMLGLPAEATEDQMKTTLSGFLERVKGAEKVAEDAPKAMAALEGARTQLSEQVTTLAAQVKAKDEEILKLTTEKQEAAATAFVEGLVKDGKIVPAQSPDVKALHLANPETAAKLFANAAKVVVLGEQGVSGSTAPSDKGEAVKRFSALMDEHAKAGLSTFEASRRIATEHPEVFKAANQA